MLKLLIKSKYDFTKLKETNTDTKELIDRVKTYAEKPTGGTI